MNPISRIALVALLAAPTVAHGVHRGGEAAWLLALLFLLPVALAWKDPVRGILAAMAGAFVLPLVPVMLHLMPFSAERVWIHGTLAGLILGGGVALRATGRLARALRWTVALGAAWSIAAGIRGVLVALPEGAPWVGEMLTVAARDLVLPRPQVEAIHPLAVLELRLEYLALLWLAGELLVGREDALRRVLRTIAWMLLAGLVFGAADFVIPTFYRGEDLMERLGAQFPRNHRPLLDHNALGTTMVALLPVLLGCVIAVFVGRRSGERAPLNPALAIAAFTCASLYLVSSRSKAALGAFVVALALVALVTFGVRRALRTWWIAGPAFLGFACVVGLQYLPVEAAQRLAANRYLADVIRVGRLDAATDYLRANRSAPWTAALEMGLEAPLLGQGLGRVPARMVDFRDPDRRVQFNPLHENAHNQVLQSFAEEGAVGVVLLLVPFGLAVAGARRSLRRRRDGAGEGGESREWPVAAGLVVAPAALLFNLQVGHALLEPSVAYIVAILFGATASLGMGTREPSGETPVPDVGDRLPWFRDPRRVVPVAGIALLGIAPALWAPRPPLAGFSFGCFPWVEWPGGQRDRLLGPDARWIQVWGDGPRIKMPVKDGRSALYETPWFTDVWLNGELTTQDYQPPRKDPAVREYPTAILFAQAPDAFAEGELVEVRVVTDPPYAESMHYDIGRPWFGLRIGEPFFRRPPGAPAPR